MFIRREEIECINWRYIFFDELQAHACSIFLKRLKYTKKETCALWRFLNGNICSFLNLKILDIYVVGRGLGLIVCACGWVCCGLSL